MDRSSIDLFSLVADWTPSPEGVFSFAFQSPHFTRLLNEGNMTDKPSPKSHIEVLIGDEKRELFMSFGLLNESTRLVGDLNRVAAIGLNPDLSIQILAAVLAPRDAKGRIADDFVLPEMSPENAEQILDWVKEHVLDFFIRRLRKTLTLVDQNAEQLKAIGSSLTGLGSAASKTP
jgi:hypothetical protein